MHWTLIKPSGDCPAPRGDAASVVSGDNVCVAGGRSGHVEHRDVWSFSLASQVWRPEHVVGEAPVRVGQQTSAFFNGKNLVAWAGHGDALYHNKLWIFDPRASGWARQTVRHQTPYQPSYAQTNVQAIDPAHGPVVFGGDDGCCSDKLQQLDLRSNAWLLAASKGEVPTPRHSHSTAVDVDAKTLCVTGGHDGATCSDVHSLDLATMQWTKVRATGPPLKPCAAASSVLAQQKLYIYGGFCGDRYHSHTSYLSLKNPPAFRDAAVPEPPAGRASAAVCAPRAGAESAAAATPVMYCFGGYDGAAYLNELLVLQSG